MMGEDRYAAMVDYVRQRWPGAWPDSVVESWHQTIVTADEDVMREGLLSFVANDQGAPPDSPGELRELGRKALNRHRIAESADQTTVPPPREWHEQIERIKAGVC
jgi:hypothetical protein